MANTRARSYNTLTYNGGKHLLNTKIAVKKRLLNKYRFEPRSSFDFGEKLGAKSKFMKPLHRATPENIQQETTVHKPESSLSPVREESASTVDEQREKAMSLERVVERCRLKSSEKENPDTAHKSALESLQDVVESVNATDSVPQPEQITTERADLSTASKRYLSPFAKSVLNDWFRKHLYRPYPTYSEKKELAKLCGISSSKVDTWFANKRNRTHNTKKLPPKYSHLLSFPSNAC